MEVCGNRSMAEVEFSKSGVAMAAAAAAALSALYKQSLHVVTSF